MHKSTEAKLAEAPAMEFSDEAAWKSWKDNNTDPVGGSVFTYAELWGRLMELELSSGKKLEDIAGPTSFEADIDGVMSFATHGAAVRILAACWRYGDQLRRWYDNRYGASA